MDLFTMARPGALLRIMLLLAVLVAIGESYTSHYCYKTETIREAYNDLVCYSYGPYCCWRWVIKYREVVKIKKVCCPGWTSCYCHRPICKPRCQERGVCVGPDDCYCRNGATGTCKTAACTTKQDCYPGTCPAPGDPEDTCQCSSGYEGTNCEKITDGPTFQSCSVQLVSTTDQQNTLLDQKCGDNIADNFTVYSNNRDYDLLLNWKTTYDFPPDILSEGLGPTYLLKYAPGIVDAHASVKVKAQNDEIEIDFPSAWVSTSVSEDVPRLINVNSDVFFSVNKAMKHLDVLDVELFATTGGHKELHDRGNGGGFIRHYFSGEQLSQRVRVVFDLVKPVHCSADSSCEIGDWGFPLKVEPDITKDNVTIIWSNWNDTDSGIGSFSYEIFPMGKNQNGQLSELTNAVASGIWEDDAGPPTYSPTTTGMYSVILTVTDQAGNENKARSLFLYDPVGHLETTASGISVSNGNEQNSLWINSVQNASNGNNLEVTWKDHFVNRFYIDNDLLGDVALFTAGEFDDTDGNRTTVAITSNNGVQNFQVGFTVAQSADSLTDEPSEWKDREQLDSASLSVMRQDGDHVRIFVKATDVAQFVMVDTIDITVDSSAPELNSGNTMFNVNAPTIYPLPKFASTVNLNIVDEQSGLSNIDYDLYEVSARQQENKIQTGTQNVHTQEKSTRCTLNGDCYCLRTGTCYTRTQAVYLNNCWFMNRDVNTYRLKFQVRNGAGLTTLGQYDIPDVTNLDGEGEYPGIPENQLQLVVGKLTEYSATLEWRLPQACYKISSTMLLYTVLGKPKEEVVLAQEVELEGLCSATEYTVQAAVLYANGAKSEPLAVKFTTLEGDSRCGGGGLSVGAIVGIVIGILILLVLLALLFVLLWRKYRQKQPMLPSSITRPISRFLPERFQDHATPPPYIHSETPAVVVKCGSAYDNAAYACGGLQEDMYVDESELTARWKFSNNRIRLGGYIPNFRTTDKGRFADIRMATLKTKSGNREVVGKLLTPTANKKDRSLMEAKMNFFGNRLTFHRNVLNFIGALPDHESGPVLLFDYCNRGSLLEWLKKQSRIDEDVEFNMSNFCIMIACGMEFLHEAEIIHKRLGARNVYLMEKDGALHAKIAGFGPTREEGTNSKRIPARWFAPEQMDATDRIYNEETDVWTFAITVYEIYSKGGKPFPSIEVPELKRHITNGYCMEKPDFCPDYLYENVMHPCWSIAPSARPTISDVYVSLKDHFEGPGGQTGYYDQDELIEEEDELYFDAASLKPAMKPGY